MPFFKETPKDKYGNTLWHEVVIEGEKFIGEFGLPLIRVIRPIEFSSKWPKVNSFHFTECDGPASETYPPKVN